MEWLKEFSLLVIEITRGFTRDNTLELPILDGDVDIKGVYEHKQIGQKYIEYMINEWKFWLKFDPLFWLKMTHLQIEIITLNFVIFIL